MRDKFKILLQDASKLRDCVSMSTEQHTAIGMRITECESFSDITNIEKVVLTSAKFWHIQRGSCLRLETEFLENDPAKLGGKFATLKDLIEIMKKPISIPPDDMRLIWTYIDVCDHIKQTTPQKNLVQTAKTLWLDRMREHQEKARKQQVRMGPHSTRRALQYTADDRRYLKKLRISTEDGPSEIKDTKLLPPGKHDSEEIG